MDAENSDGDQRAATLVKCGAFPCLVRRALRIRRPISLRLSLRLNPLWRSCLLPH
jgi:hypothetical protein